MPLPPPAATDSPFAAELAALVTLDPLLAPIAAAAGTLPERRIEPGFAGFVWMVTGQQISVAAARAIYGRCEAALGAITPEAVATNADEVLRAAGQSTAKIRTLRAASEAVLAGELDLLALGDLAAEEAIARLCTLKGVGPWTAEVYLLFALRHPDIFPAGDLALQEAARAGLGLDARPSTSALRARADIWRPHRSVAARLLWAYYRTMKQGRDGAPI
jgi:DNA-3-methyladenine glycosylase II